MDSLYSTTYSFSCCQSSQEKEAYFSKPLRITAVVLGVIGIIGGLAIGYGFSGLNQFKLPGMLISLSTGAILIAIGNSLKCTTRPLQENSLEPSSKDSKELVLPDTKTIALGSGSSSAVTLHKKPIFIPTWYQRKIEEGFTQGKTMDFESDPEKLKTIKILAGAHRSDIQQVNFFPLLYKLDLVKRKIDIDLSSHWEVKESNVSIVKTQGTTYYSRASSLPLIGRLFSTGKGFQFSKRTGWSHFIFKEMPGVVFFASENGVQCEIGYLNVHEAIGGTAEIAVHKDHTINYEKVMTSSIEEVDESDTS